MREHENNVRQQEKYELTRILNRLEIKWFWKKLTKIQPEQEEIFIAIKSQFNIEIKQAVGGENLKKLEEALARALEFECTKHRRVRKPNRSSARNTEGHCWTNECFNRNTRKIQFLLQLWSSEPF